MSAIQNKGMFPISSVANLTGVNAITLRAWERRYGLVKPTRTPAGHRLYAETDIETIKQILKLLDEGIAISRVSEAMRIAAERENQPVIINEGHWHKYQTEMLLGVKDFDETRLHAVYNETMSLYPVEMVTSEMLLPLLEKLGERWAQVSAGVAEEHFFSVFLRNKLGARFHHLNQRNTGPKLIAACLPGEHHEFGLLLFCLSAHVRGYRIVLLGADMPVEQIAEVVDRASGDGVVLSGSILADADLLQQQIHQLTRDTQAPVWVGGTTAEKLRTEIEAAGAIAVGADLIIALYTIGKMLPLTT